MRTPHFSPPPPTMRSSLLRFPAAPGMLILLITLSVGLVVVLVSVHKQDIFSVTHHHYELDSPNFIDDISKNVDTDKLIRDKAKRARQLAQQREQKEREMQQQ